MHWKTECERRWKTHGLTDDGVLDPVDASGEHGERQGRVEAEVEKHVPSFPTDPDCAG